MFDVVRDVGQVGAARFEFFDVRERAFEREVRRVRREAQAIEDEHVETAQTVERGGRNLAEVGSVGEIVAAISDDGQPPVNDFERRHLKIMTEAKRRAVNDRMRNDLRQPAAKVRRLEDVLKDAPDVFPRAFVGIETERAVAKVERADVIEAEDVVGMAMRDEHGVEPFQFLPERLLAKV